MFLKYNKQNTYACDMYFRLFIITQVEKQTHVGPCGPKIHLINARGLFVSLYILFKRRHNDKTIIKSCAPVVTVYVEGEKDRVEEGA